MTTPGRGASLLAPPQGQHVYVVRSRRTGEVSIGVDMTPNGACPLSCDYCQVPRTERSAPVPVDLARVRDELTAALERTGREAGDVVFAGSGEPTWPGEFPAALELARALVRASGLAIPVRVLTCGATLERADVQAALGALVASGEGEVWVKLDGWDEATHRRFWGTRGQAEHEARIEAFGRKTPVVVQSMLVRRHDAPSPGETAEGLAAAVTRLLAAGCRVQRVILSTLFRTPGDGDVELAPLTKDEIEVVARAVRATGAVVQVPAMAG